VSDDLHECGERDASQPLPVHIAPLEGAASGSMRQVAAAPVKQRLFSFDALYAQRETAFCLKKLVQAGYHATKTHQ